MPRTSIWFSQVQLEQVHQTFGEGVKLSGVVRVALARLLSETHQGRSEDTIDLVACVSKIEDLTKEIADLQADDAKRRPGRKKVA